MKNYLIMPNFPTLYFTPDNGGNGGGVRPDPLRNDTPDTVLTLDDLALSHITIDQFSFVRDWRERIFRKSHSDVGEGDYSGDKTDGHAGKDGTPRICDELPRNLTKSLQGSEGKGMSNFARRVEALNYVFSQKTPLVKKSDLLAGQTTTSFVGPVVYADTIGYCIWPELETVSKREKNPYKVTRKVIDSLSKEVFPYWLGRKVTQEYARYHDYDTDNYKDDGRDRVDNGKLENGKPSIDPALNKPAGVTPKCQETLERIAFFLSDKATCVSHTVPDFNRLLKFGLNGLIEQMEKDLVVLEKGDNAGKEKKLEFLKGVIKVFEGAKTYASRLADAAEDSGNFELAEICKKVPAQPAETLHEALNSIWICYHLLLQENTNFGFSIGRMDQLLNKYYIDDWNKKSGTVEKKDYTTRSVELMCHFFLHCCDHVPLSTEGGDALFAGSGSNQALTVGGVNYINGNAVDAVNDMTYIILKATEILSVRDPNIHTRYHSDIHKSTDGVYSAYLKRIAQVNLITKATPAIHGDLAVIKSMESYYAKFNGISKDEARSDAHDYCSIGCIEENSAARHYGNTGSTLFVLPAVLELALYGGKHRMTGIGKNDPYLLKGDGYSPERDYKTTPFVEMRSMEEFRDAFKTQLDNLAFYAVQSNNYFGRAMEAMRQVPFLSGLFIGPTNTPEYNGATFTDLSAGGARYNSSGVAVIGLADVIDSFCVIDYLVFQEERITAAQLMAAVNVNFGVKEDVPFLKKLLNWLFGNNIDKTGLPKLSGKQLDAVNRALKVAPFFGAGGVEKEGKSDNSMAVHYTNYLTELIQETFFKYKSYRGGRYLVGYWSMTNHAGFGSLAKATPNGRHDAVSFASGITPCSGNITRNGKVIKVLDHIKSVTTVNGDTVQNGYTYNLSLTPGSVTDFTKDTERFAGYIKSFMDQGGVLVQLCVDSIKDFKAAHNIVSELENENKRKIKNRSRIEHLEKEQTKYNDLMIRVAGYSAYFVDMNKTMRDEVIARANFSIETGKEEHLTPYKSVQIP